MYLLISSAKQIMFSQLSTGWRVGLLAVLHKTYWTTLKETWWEGNWLYRKLLNFHVDVDWAFPRILILGDRWALADVLYCVSLV